jgi:hypothetical protein
LPVSEPKPFRVRRRDLRVVIDACGLTPDDRSPLLDALDLVEDPIADRRLVYDADFSDVDPAADVPAELRAALGVLASPRWLLTIDDRTSTPRMVLDLYLSDELAVALRTSSAGWLAIALPADQAVIRDQLVDLMTGQAGGMEKTYTVPDSVLIALDHCIAAGLDQDAAVDRDALIEALSRVGLEEVMAGRTLDALISDDLLASAGAGVVLGPACIPWRQAFPLAARLRITADDLAVPWGGATQSLEVAGPYRHRLLAADDPEAEEPGALFRTLTPAEAAQAVAVLLDGESNLRPAFARPAASPPRESAPNVGSGVLSLSGVELFALCDLIWPATDAAADDSEVPEWQTDIRAGVAEGRRRLAARGLITGDPPLLPVEVAEAMLAWQDPTLVVNVELTDTRHGTADYRCCVRGDLLVVEEVVDDAWSLQVLAAAELEPTVGHVTGLDRGQRAATDGLDWVVDPSRADDAVLPAQADFLVRVAAHYRDGDLLRGGETQFAFTSVGECWEIEEIEPLFEDSATPGRLRFSPIDAESLLASITGWLPAQAPVAT